MKNTPASDAPPLRKAGWFTGLALEDALPRDGCVICEALNTSVRQHIFNFLYEGMMSGDVREEFLQGGGFCAEHFRQAKAIEQESWTDGFGVAVLCENLLANVLEELEASKPTNQNGSMRRLLRGQRRRLREPLAAARDCIACAGARESEQRYLEGLEEMLSEPAFNARYQQSKGLCLVHLRLAVQAWTSLSALHVVREVAKVKTQKLVTELREFERKHDHRYRSEPRGQESSSPERAIEFLTGSDCRGLARTK